MEAFYDRYLPAGTPITLFADDVGQFNTLKLLIAEPALIDTLTVGHGTDRGYFTNQNIAVAGASVITLVGSHVRIRVTAPAACTLRYGIILSRHFLQPAPVEPPPPPPPVTGPLAGEMDDLEAAYAMRQLISTYEGDALQLEGTSGAINGVTYEAGFDEDGDLDMAAITAWLNGESARINIWYDQSGNGRNLVLSGSHPQWDDANAAISIGADKQRLRVAMPNITTAASMFAVYSVYGANATMCDWGENGFSDSGLALGNYQARPHGDYEGDTPSAYWRDTAMRTSSVIYTGAATVAHRDATELLNALGGGNTYTQDLLTVGDDSNAATDCTGGKIKELLCWGTNKSAFRTTWRDGALTAYSLAGGSLTAVTGAYDSYLTGAVGMFGLRQLRATYAGPLLNINGFAAYPDSTGFVDTAEIAASGQTEITTWYDQSSGGYDLGKITTGPSYTTNASYTINSLPVIRSTSGSTILRNTSFVDIVGSNPWAVYCRIRIDGTNDMTMFAWCRNSGGAPYGPWLERGNIANTVELQYGDGLIQVRTSDTGGDDAMFTSMFDGTDLTLWKAGTQKGYTEPASTTITETQLLLWQHPGFSGTVGSMAELLLYNNVDHTSIRPNIETVMSSMWGVGEGPAGIIDALGLSLMRGAWSTRKLNSGYSGYCVELRKSSGGSSQFGFTANGDLDTAAITSWAGADTLYVRTWYDQSGYGTDLAQTTNSLQPILSLSDSSMNNKPTVQFTGSQYYTIPWTHATSYSVTIRLYLPAPPTNGTNAVLCFAESSDATTSGGGDLYYFDTAGTKTLTWRIGSSANDIDLSPTGDQNVSYLGSTTGSTNNFYVDGSANSKSTTLTDTNTHFHLGRQQFGTFTGSVGDCVIWTSTSTTGYAQWMSDMGHEYFG